VSSAGLADGEETDAGLAEDEETDDCVGWMLLIECFVIVYQQHPN
jgi:hypothetical protein